MRCPRCLQEGSHPYTPCTQCGFAGPPAQVEELGHIVYLLDELGTWREVEASAREALRTRYVDRREELELALGLRPPPLTAEEARDLQWELFCLGALQEEVAHWQVQDWVRPWPADRLRQGAQKRIESLRKRLTDAMPAPAFDDVEHQLKRLDYLEGMLALADRRGHFVSNVTRTAAQDNLQARRRELEIAAGLRPRLVEAVAPAVIAATAAAAPPSAVEVPVRPSKPPKPPREPITWDRVWQTLLSERTLNVLLFLGAFLLVASATTYIVYNWETLPPAVQLGFIVLFTLSFYGAGWFLRVRMKLRASGIAVTAIGSLLVPLDFYAVGVVGGVVPANQWPWVWLIASLVCLPVYTFTTLRIQARFFGYLVVTAEGSLLCAGLWVTGVPPVWLLAALVALALGLFALAYRLRTVPGRSPWRILDAPFRFSALFGAAAILPLGIGWWLASGARGLHFDASLAVAWTLGAVLYGYAAIREGSPWLGRGAATIWPGSVLLVLRLAFEPLGIEAPWYAAALAALAPLYLWAGYRLHSRALLASSGSDRAAQAGEEGIPVLRAYSQTATGWGLALMALAAAWSVFDLWAAAVTHAMLALGVALAIRLWQRPRVVPAASLLALSSLTFGMAAGHLELAELCVGWALLALLHLLAALRLQAAAEYAARLFACALALSGLALLPPLILADEWLLTYVLGQWIAVAAWLIRLDHSGQHRGLTDFLSRFGPLRGSVLHWAVALPLPIFAAMVYTRFRAPDAWLGLLLAILAWALVAIGQLRRVSSTSAVFRRMPGFSSHPLLRHWSLPWYVVAYGCSLAGPALALYAYDQVLVAVTILLASALYFASALAFRARWWLVPAGLALPLGLLILLDSWALPLAQQSTILSGVVAAYLLGGLGLERGRRDARDFLAPLYAVAHLVAGVALAWGLAPAVESLFGGLLWPDPARLWTAGGQLVLTVAYGLFAWFHARERWAHLAAWLGVLAAALVASVFSQGRGSSAFYAALLAALYVLAERALAAEHLQRRRPMVRQAWSLYRRPLLIAGWTASAGAIGLALIRNLAFLGGGRAQAAWAIAALLAITALYAGAAWLFQRRLFVWLAGALVILPWTLLAAWGWYIWPAPPALPRYALSWTILACLQLGLGLSLAFRSPSLQSADYGFPLRLIANVLLPFALLWAVADPATSSLTWGLGLAFYVISTVADHRRGLSGWRAARFLYPAVAVLPVWAIYLLNRGWPSVPYEVYGLLLLGLALPLLALGRLLRRIEPADGVPPTLATYGVAIVGTMLVGHQPSLFAAALAFDALLCVLSAWIFREPLWGYPAVALAPAAMLVALAQSQAVPPERRGWWLIGLGAAYLGLAWLLRRVGLRRAGLHPADLQAYASPPLAAAFAVIALGLPPSSLDETGAFWAYLAAALLYALAAFWLWQPLLLGATAALLAVPYGVGLVWLGVDPANYGLALFPGVAAALALAHLLDWRLGRPGPIPIGLHPKSWRLGALLDWWAAPFYAWGYAGALVAIGLSGQGFADSTRLAFALALAALTFLHATWRFRSRAYLLLAGTLAQAAALTLIDRTGWLGYPAWTALAFLPVTLVTAALALAVQLWQHEGSPLGAAWWRGWSRPLYLLLALDLLAGQVAALFQPEPGAVVTVAHAMLMALLATVWGQPILPFAAAVLGAVGTAQAMAWVGVELTAYPVGMALLALFYGLVGYGVRFAWRQVQRARIWLRPLEWAALGLSVVALIEAVAIGFDVGNFLVRTLLGQSLTLADYAPQLQMVMWVLALSGLLYLTTAAVHRWLVLGYGAVALLLASWGLWWRFFMHMAGVQWYTVPAGLYLLGVGWLEWRQGRGTLSHWIDRAGILVLLGTAWWQSLPGVMDSGWPYALLMGVESLLLVWWGSARRQKQFLYVGAVSLVVNVITQSIEPLLSVNRWIVFGIAGLLLVGIAILVERKLEAIRNLSVEMRARLEGWE